MFLPEKKDGMSIVLTHSPLVYSGTMSRLASQRKCTRQPTKNTNTKNTKKYIFFKEEVCFRWLPYIGSMAFVDAVAFVVWTAM